MRGREIALIVGLVLLAVAIRRDHLPWHASDGQTGGQPVADVFRSPSASAPPSETPRTAVLIPSIGATIPVGETPGFVAVAPNGRQLYVANRDAGVVTVVDTAVDEVSATIRIDAGPASVHRVQPRRQQGVRERVGRAGHRGDQRRPDTTTNSVVETIPVDTRPFLAAVSPDGKLIYVPNHDTDSVSVIDAATYELVTNIDVAPNPHWVAFTADGSKAYTANHDSNVVSAIDTATNTVTTEIPAPTSPHSIAVHPTRPILIVATYDADSARVIDTNTDQVITTIPVGAFPQHAAWSADGRFAYITNNEDNSISVIDGETFDGHGTILTGESPRPSRSCPTAAGATSATSATAR